MAFESIHKFLSDERQLEADEVLMARLEILQKGRHGQTGGIVEIAIAIDCEVDHSKEGVCVDMLFLAHLAHGLVAKTKADAETAQTLEQIVVVPDKRDHLVIRLIHFVIFHLVVCLYLNYNLVPNIYDIYTYFI